jgi:hypothetical protein
MSKERAISDLIKMLNNTRDFLSRPENDFVYSGWDNVQDALEEFDTLIARLRKNDLPSRLELSVLFAPTGPIQELSVRSGWGDECLVLANEFDAALEDVYQ